MKKSVFVLALSALFLGACNNAASKIKSEGENAQASTEMNNGSAENNMAAASGTPEFTFSEENHDFGTIEEGTIAKYDFEFTNTGDAPLIITNASGSCGCTVPQWPREPIAPGETGKIHVEFNSNNRTGNQTKQVTLSANTVPNKKVLRISALVNPKPKADSQG